MEEICLVTALTVSDFIDPDLTVDAHSKTGAQLGVLTLAALLRQQNYVPQVINLDDLFFEFVRLDKSRPSLSHDRQAGSKPPETFFSFVARHLPAGGFDVYGLSSICSSYPLTLRLAQEIRRLNPHAMIILGGPQASVVDVATMQAFPSIDIIVRGEADDTFPALLLRDTLHFFIDSLRFDHAEPQCSLLAPLAATPVYDEHKHHLVFDQIYSDMSHQSWQQDPVEIEMIKVHEDIFPNFYAIPTPELERSYVKEVIDFATYLATWFRWLPVAILQDSGDMLSVFDRWRRWRVERRASETDEDNGWTPYYSHRRFHTEFLEFVETCYLPEMAKASAAIAAISRTENVPAREPRKPIVQETHRLDESAVPYKLDSLFIVDLEVDYKELIERLRSKGDLNEVSACDATVVFSNENDDLEVWQLPPLAGILLRLCDGKRTVAEITYEFSILDLDLNEIAPEKACLFGLVQLLEDGVVGLSSVPLRWEDEAMPNFSFPPKASNTQQPWPPDRQNLRNLWILSANNTDRCFVTCSAAEGDADEVVALDVD